MHLTVLRRLRRGYLVEETAQLSLHNSHDDLTPLECFHYLHFTAPITRAIPSELGAVKQMSQPPAIQSSSELFLTARREGVIPLGGVWCGDGERFFLLRQNTGSRETGQSATLVLEQYTKDLQRERSVLIATQKRWNDFETTATLSAVEGNFLLLVLSSAELEKIDAAPVKMPIPQSGFCGLVLSKELKTVAQFLLIGVDPTSLVTETAGSKIFVAASKCGLGMPFVYVQGDYQPLDALKIFTGSFVVCLRLSMGGGVFSLTYEWSRSFGPKDAALSFGLAGYPARDPEKPPHSVRPDLADKLKKVGSPLERPPAEACGGPLHTTQEAPQQVVMDMASVSDASSRLLVVGQFRGSVRTGDLLVEKRCGSWACLIDDDGTAEDLWDLAPGSSQDASFLVESVLFHAGAAQIAGRASGTVMLDQLRVFADGLPEMSLPGEQRGGFVAGFAVPVPGGQVSYSWSIKLGLCFVPRLSRAGRKVLLAGFFWKTLTIADDAPSAQCDGSGALDRFVVEIDQNGVYRCTTLQGVELQRSRCIAPNGAKTLIIASAIPFHHSVGVAKPF